MGARRPILGHLVPYLGGPFGAFETPTVWGLGWVRGDRLDLLALVAVRPGCGDVGRFLADCQAAYRVIGAWEIGSDRLRGMLERRGFQPAREVLDGELSEGMLWQAPDSDAPENS